MLHMIYIQYSMHGFHLTVANFEKMESKSYLPSIYFNVD